MRQVEDVLKNIGISEMAIDAAKENIGNDNTDALWRYFVARGQVTENQVFQSLAETSGLEFVDLKNYDLSDEAIRALPGAFCRDNKIISLQIRRQIMFIGVSDPNNFKAIDEVSVTTSYDIVTKIVTPSALQETLDRVYRADEEIEKLSEEIEQNFDSDEDDEEENIDLEDQSPVVRFVNLLISQAIQDRASDIHVEPGEKELTVRYRIDGVLHTVQKADKNIQNGVISRLKVMSDIDIGEKRKPQDGRLSFKKSGIDIRVVTLPTTWGEKVVMRILDHSDDKKSLDTIGMSAANQEIFENAINRPHGMILVTGPTGSGKSTTIYTALGEVSKPTVNVMTVEDPVEKKIKGINQIQINNKANMTFSNALRAILRADPDIVFIGEIRDEETAKIAIDASMTGHLVLSTLHTNGAPEAAARLIEMGVEPYLVGNSVTCVVAQRLARRLCVDCKKEIDISQETLAKAGFPYVGKTLYGSVGCKNCAKTGYRGRIALTEVMSINENIEKLINQRKTATEIRHEAEKFGMQSLKMDGFMKVADGLTTLDEILRIAV